MREEQTIFGVPITSWGTLTIVAKRDGRFSCKLKTEGCAVYTSTSGPLSREDAMTWVKRAQRWCDANGARCTIYGLGKLAEPEQQRKAGGDA